MINFQTTAEKLTIAARYFQLGAGHLRSTAVMEHVRTLMAKDERNDGRPAFIHQLQIYHYLRAFHQMIPEFEVLAEAIWAHDVAEEYVDEWEYLSGIMSERAVMLVQSVTKPPAVTFNALPLLGEDGLKQWKQEQFEEYISNCIQADPLSYILKLADRINNMSTAPTVFKAHRLERYINETTYMISRVKDARRMYPQYEAIYESLKINLLQLLELAIHIQSLRKE